MGTASHLKRLKRLEASQGEQHLAFMLSDWAPGCPIGFESKEEREALDPGVRAHALDNLIAAGKIRERDRERVVFVVRTFARPTRPEQLEPYPRGANAPDEV